MSKLIKIGRIGVNLEGCENLSRKDIDSMFRNYSEEFRDEFEAEVAKAYPKKKKKKKSKEGEE